MTRLLLLSIAASIVWCPNVFGQNSASTGSGSVEQLEGEPTASKKKKRAKKKVKEEDLPSLKEVKSGLVGLERKRNGITFYEYSSFKIGVTELDVPGYDGWVDLASNEKVRPLFADKGKAGERLESILVLKPDKKRATVADISKFYSLIWVPEAYEFKLFSPSSFNRLKQEIREKILVERKTTANRDDFESFDDYINYKFGADDQLTEVKDGVLIEIASKDELMSHFYTSTLRIGSGKSFEEHRQVTTTTLALVRDKLVRIEFHKIYYSDDDITLLLDIGEQFVEDFRRVNEVKR